MTAADDRLRRVEALTVPRLHGGETSPYAVSRLGALAPKGDVDPVARWKENARRRYMRMR